MSVSPEAEQRESRQYRARWTDHLLMVLIIAAQITTLLVYRGILAPGWLDPIRFVFSSWMLLALAIIVIKTILRVDVSFGLGFGQWNLLFALTWLIAMLGTQIIFAIPGLAEHMSLRRLILYIAALVAGSGFVALVTYVVLAIYLVWPLGPRRRPIPPTN